MGSMEVDAQTWHAQNRLGSSAIGIVPAFYALTRPRKFADQSGGSMKSLSKLLVATGAAALLAGCSHNGPGSTVATSSGDVTVDSLSATRTAILRIESNYPSEVRVYTLIGGHENYIAKAMNGETRTWVLDPNLFPASNISFVAKSADGQATKTLGPFKVAKGEVVDVVIPTDIANARASVHHSGS
jgi:hypothetical protein